MGYTDYLIQLLKPLGVYDFEEGSYNLAELQVLGAAFDDCCGGVTTLERECVVPTAEDYGLSMYEAILPSSYGTDVESRRKAIISLLSINNLHLTDFLLNRVLAGCGTDVTVSETSNKYEVLVEFPNGEPENAENIKKRIESILPCHLSVIYSYSR